MIEDLFETVYEKCDGIAVGQFVWCPVPHLEEVPRILEVDRASSHEHYATKFEIVQLNGDHFKERTKLPIKALSLRDTEELLISKAKRRPCVVVACQNTAFGDAPIVAETKKRRHLQDQSMLLAPIYGAATPDNDSGFPPIMVARIRALLYNQFFYLPAKCPKTKLGFPKVGIVRLDRIFPAAPNRGVSLTGFGLSQEPRTLLQELLLVRFGGKTSNNLETVKSILWEALPEEARPRS